MLSVLIASAIGAILIAGMGNALVSQSQSQYKIQKKYKRDWAKMKIYLAINNLATNPPNPRPSSACKKEIERVLKSQDLIRPIEVTDPSKSTGANFELSLDKDDAKFTLDEGVTLEQCCELYKQPDPEDASRTIDRCGRVASLPASVTPGIDHCHKAFSINFQRYVYGCRKGRGTGRGTISIGDVTLPVGTQHLLVRFRASVRKQGACGPFYATLPPLTCNPDGTVTPKTITLSRHSKSYYRRSKPSGYTEFLTSTSASAHGYHRIQFYKKPKP